MATNKDNKKEIEKKYNEIKQEYNKILENKTIINNTLSKFVVDGTPVGSGIYDDGTYTGVDIELPNDPVEYQQAINMVSADIEAIETLITKAKNLLAICETSGNSNEYLNIINDLKDIINKLSTMKEARETVINNLRLILVLLEQAKNNNLEEKEVKKNDDNPGYGETLQPSNKEDVDKTNVESLVDTLFDSDDDIIKTVDSNYMSVSSTHAAKHNRLTHDAAEKHFENGTKKIENADDSLGNLLSGLFYGSPPKAIGDGSYLDPNVPENAADINGLDTVRLAEAYRAADKQIEAKNTMITDLTNEIERLQNDLDSGYWVKGMDTDGDGIADTPDRWVYTYDDPSVRQTWQDNITNYTKQIETLTSEIEDLNSIKDEIAVLLNELTRINGDQMAAYTLASLGNILSELQGDESLVLAGHKYSAVELRNVYSKLIDQCESISKTALFDDKNGTLEKPEDYNGLSVSEYNAILNGSKTLKKCQLDFSAYGELSGETNRTASQEKKLDEIKNDIKETIETSHDISTNDKNKNDSQNNENKEEEKIDYTDYLTSGHLGIYASIMSETANAYNAEKLSQKVVNILLDFANIKAESIDEAVKSDSEKIKEQIGLFQLQLTSNAEEELVEATTELAKVEEALASIEDETRRAEEKRLKEEIEDTQVIAGAYSFGGSPFDDVPMHADTNLPGILAQNEEYQDLLIQQQELIKARDNASDTIQQMNTAFRNAIVNLPNCPMTAYEYYQEKLDNEISRLYEETMTIENYDPTYIENKAKRNIEQALVNDEEYNRLLENGKIASYEIIEDEPTIEYINDSFAGTYEVATKHSHLQAFDKNGNKIEATSSDFAMYFLNHPEINIPNGIENRAEIADYLSNYHQISPSDLAFINFVSTNIPTINLQNISADGTVTIEPFDYTTYASEQAIDFHNYQIGMEQAKNFLSKITHEDGSAKNDTGWEKFWTGFHVANHSFWETGVAGNLEQFASLFKYASGRTTASDYRNQAVNTYISTYLPQEYGFIYEFSSMIGNMAPSIAIATIGNLTGIGLIAYLGQLEMGASAAASSRTEGIRMGLTQDQAWTYGILNGLSEVGLEFLLGNIPGYKHLFETGYFAGALGEGVEEALQEILGPYMVALASASTVNEKGQTVYTTDIKDSATGEIIHMAGDVITLKNLQNEVDMEAVVHSGVMGVLSSLFLNGLEPVSNAYSQIRTGDMTAMSKIYNLELNNAFTEQAILKNAAKQGINISQAINSYAAKTNVDVSQVNTVDAIMDVAESSGIDPSQVADLSNVKLSSSELLSARLEAFKQMRNDIAKINENEGKTISKIKENLSTDPAIIKIYEAYNSSRNADERISFDDFISDVAINTALTISKNGDISLDENILSSMFEVDNQKLERSIKKKEAKLKKSKDKLEIEQLEKGIKKLQSDIENNNLRSNESKQLIEEASINNIAEEIASQLFPKNTESTKKTYKEVLKDFFTNFFNKEKIPEKPIDGYIYLNEKLTTLENELKNSDERISKHGATEYELEYRKKLQSEIDETKTNIDKLGKLIENYDSNLIEKIQEKTNILSDIKQLELEIEELQNSKETVGEYHGFNFEKQIENKTEDLNKAKDKLDKINEELIEPNNTIDASDIIGNKVIIKDNVIIKLREIINKHKNKINNTSNTSSTDSTINNYLKIQDRIEALKQNIVELKKGPETNQSLDHIMKFQNEIDLLTKEAETIKQTLNNRGFNVDAILQEYNQKQKDLKVMKTELEQIDAIEDKYERSNKYNRREQLIAQIATVESQILQLKNYIQEGTTVNNNSVISTNTRNQTNNSTVVSETNDTAVINETLTEIKTDTPELNNNKNNNKVREEELYPAKVDRYVFDKKGLEPLEELINEYNNTLKIDKKIAEELREFYNSNGEYVVGLHLTGIADPQSIINEGLWLTGDATSGLDNAGQDLNNNISFEKKETTGFGFPLFCAKLGGAAGYKTYGLNEGGAILIKIPKEYLEVDGYGWNVKPEYRSELIDATEYPTLKSEFLFGYLKAKKDTDGTTIFSKIIKNPNYKSDAKNVAINQTNSNVSTAVNSVEEEEILTDKEIDVQKNWFEYIKEKLVNSKKATYVGINKNNSSSSVTTNITQATDNSTTREMTENYGQNEELSTQTVDNVNKNNSKIDELLTNPESIDISNNETITQQTEKTLTPYQEIAKDALKNWNGLTEEEANVKVSSETVEQLESQVYAMSSVESATNGIGKYVKLIETELTEFKNAVLNGPANAEIFSKINKKLGDVDRNQFSLTILKEIHDAWVENNSSEKIFEKKLERQQLRQYAPLELIGWNEVESDLLFLKPILKSVGIELDVAELKTQYEQLSENYLKENNIKTIDDLKNLLKQGTEYYSPLNSELSTRLNDHIDELTNQIVDNLKKNDSKAVESLTNSESINISNTEIGEKDEIVRNDNDSSYTAIEDGEYLTEQEQIENISWFQKLKRVFNGGIELEGKEFDTFLSKMTGDYSYMIPKEYKTLRSIIKENNIPSNIVDILFQDGKLNLDVLGHEMYTDFSASYTNNAIKYTVDNLTKLNQMIKEGLELADSKYDNVDRIKHVADVVSKNQKLFKAIEKIDSSFVELLIKNNIDLTGIENNQLKQSFIDEMSRSSDTPKALYDTIKQLDDSYISSDVLFDAINRSNSILKYKDKLSVISNGSRYAIDLIKFDKNGYIASQSFMKIYLHDDVLMELAENGLLSETQTKMVYAKNILTEETNISYTVISSFEELFDNDGNIKLESFELILKIIGFSKSNGIINNLSGYTFVNKNGVIFEIKQDYIYNMNNFIELINNINFFNRHFNIDDLTVDIFSELESMDEVKVLLSDNNEIIAKILMKLRMILMKPESLMEKFNIDVDSVKLLNKLSDESNVKILHLEKWLDSSGKVNRYFVEQLVKNNITLFENNIWLIPQNTVHELLEETPTLLHIHEVYNELISNSELVRASKFINFFEKNIRKSDSIPSFTISQIRNIESMITRILSSNSIEMRSAGDSIVMAIATSDNYQEYFNQIESIFLKNNLPRFAKNYKVMELLYFSDEKLDSTIHTLKNIPSFKNLLNTMPQDDAIKEIKKIIFSDLIRTTFESNNRNAREYLNSIKIGNELFSKIKTREQFDNLNDSDKQMLNVYASHLDMLYQSLKGRSIVKENLSLYENLTRLNRVFTSFNRNSLPDMIVRAFAGDAGFSTYQELESFMNDSVREADKRNREFARKYVNGKVNTNEIIHKGDLVKSLKSKAIALSILGDGILTPELLLDLGSNATPWGSDFWLAFDSFSLDTLSDGVRNSYGPIQYVIPSETLDNTRHELINYGSAIDVGLVHHDVRTGIGSNHIGFFYADSTLDHDYSDVSYLKLQIVRNGFYIPIIDKVTNELAFTPEEYDMLRSRMNGLAYYNMGEYQHSEHLYENKSMVINGLFDILKGKDSTLSKIGIVNEIIGNGQSQSVSTKTYSFSAVDALNMIKNGNYSSGSQVTELYEALRDGYLDDIIRDSIKNSSDVEIERLSLLLRISELDITKKRNAVNETISRVLKETAKEFGIELDTKTTLNGEVTPGNIEILDTGSTGRGSNLPGDGDFDLMLRVDGNLYKNNDFMNRFSQKLHEEFGRLSDSTYESVSVDHYGIRDKHIKLEGLNDTLVDIDISFVQKTNRYDYSTDMALAERYDSMKDSESHDLAVANVLLTKAMMKEAECYKPNRGTNPQGGLGGIGIENLVLQNGGSLTQAAMSFVEATRNIAYKEYLDAHPKSTFVEYMNATKDSRKNYSAFSEDYMLTDFGENHFAEKRAELNNSQGIYENYYPFDNFVTNNMNEAGYVKTVEVLENYLRRNAHFDTDKVQDSPADSSKTNQTKNTSSTQSDKTSYSRIGNFFKGLRKNNNSNNSNTINKPTVTIETTNNDYLNSKKYDVLDANGRVSERITLPEVVEILNKNVKGDSETNMYNSLVTGMVTNEGKPTGIKINQVLDDIIDARKNGINIETTIELDNLLKVRSEMQEGNILLNTFDVYAGKTAIIKASDGHIKYNGVFVDVKADINKYKTRELTLKNVDEVIDTLEIIDALESNDLLKDINTEDINKLYDDVNALLINRNYLVDTPYLRKLVASFTKHYARLNGLDVQVEFTNESENNYGAHTNHVIRLNGNFIESTANSPSYVTMLETVFHELHHELQDKNSVADSLYGPHLESADNKYLLGNTIDGILKENNPSYYARNYESILFEIDARYNSYKSVINYLERIAPEKSGEYIKEYAERINTELANYEKNHNSYVTNEISLSRDSALENIIKNNPDLLKENPILNSIFNEDGSRKTLLELSEVIKNTSNSYVIDMINYWVRTSNYSLESITTEYLELYSRGIDSLSSEFIEVVKSLDNKLAETILFESNNISKQELIDKINYIIKNSQTTDIENLDEFKIAIETKINNVYEQINKSKQKIKRSIRDRLLGDNFNSNVSYNMASPAMVVDGEYLTENELSEETEWHAELNKRLSADRNIQTLGESNMDKNIDSNLVDPKVLAYSVQEKIQYLKFGYFEKKEVNWNQATFDAFFTEKLISNLYEDLTDGWNSFDHYQVSNITQYIDIEKFIGNSSLSNELKNKFIYFLSQKNADINITNVINNSNSNYVEFVKNNYLNNTFGFSFYKVADLMTVEELENFVMNNIAKQGLISDTIYYINGEIRRTEDYSKIKILLKQNGVQEIMLKEASSFEFWLLDKKVGLNKDIIEQRKQIDLEIIKNHQNYSIDSIKKALCDLYFKDNIKNVSLDIETILEFAEFNSEFTSNNKTILKLLKQVYDFFNDKSPDNVSNLIDNINSIDNNIPIDEWMQETWKNMISSFENDMNSKLTKTKENITNDIKPVKLKSSDGTNVDFYKIENQGPSQNEFLLMIHTSSQSSETNPVDFKNNYLINGEKYNKLCVSLVNNGFYGTFGKDNIILGYFQTGNKRVLSSNTQDGNTNQRNVGMGDLKARKQRILPVEQFMENTSGYNEVVLYNSENVQKAVLPDFIVSRSENPSQTEIDIAKEFGVPIYYVNKDTYIQYEAVPYQDFEMYDYESNYIQNEDYIKVAKKCATKIDTDNQTKEKAYGTTQLKDAILEQNKAKNSLNGFVDYKKTDNRFSHETDATADFNFKEFYDGKYNSKKTQIDNYHGIEATTLISSTMSVTRLNDISINAINDNFDGHNETFTSIDRFYETFRNTNMHEMVKDNVIEIKHYNTQDGKAIIISIPQSINSYQVRSLIELNNQIKDINENIKVYYQFNDTQTISYESSSNLDDVISLIEKNYDTKTEDITDSQIEKTYAFKNNQTTIEEYLHRNGINIDNVESLSKFNVGDIASTVNNALKSRMTMYSYINNNGQSGVNQSAVANIMRKGTPEAQTRLINQVKEKHPGMSNKMAKQFLLSIEGTSRSIGICNYADVANAIFEHYLSLENGIEKFEHDFGFLMHIDGKINDSGLLVDMFLNISGDKLIKQTKLGEYQVKESNRGYAKLTNQLGSSNLYSLEHIANYLKGKDLDIDLGNFKQSVLFDSKNTQKNVPIKYQANKVMINVAESLTHGEHVSLSVGPDFINNGLLFNMNSNPNKTRSGHIMTVIGISGEGQLLVESNGVKIRINLEEALSNGARFTINTLEMNLDEKISDGKASPKTLNLSNLFKLRSKSLEGKGLYSIDNSITENVNDSKTTNQNTERSLESLRVERDSIVNKKALTAEDYLREQELNRIIRDRALQEKVINKNKVNNQEQIKTTKNNVIEESLAQDNHSENQALDFIPEKHSFLKSFIKENDLEEHAHEIYKDGKLDTYKLYDAIGVKRVDITEEFMQSCFDNGLIQTAKDLLGLLELRKSVFKRAFANNELVNNIINDFNELYRFGELGIKYIDYLSEFNELTYIPAKEFIKSEILNNKLSIDDIFKIADKNFTLIADSINDIDVKAIGLGLLLEYKSYDVELFNRIIGPSKMIKLMEETSVYELKDLFESSRKNIRYISDLINNEKKLQTEAIYSKVCEALNNTYEISDFIEKIPDNSERVKLLKYIPDDKLKFLIASHFTNNEDILKAIEQIDDTNYKQLLKEQLILDNQELEEISKRNILDIKSDIIKLRQELSDKGITDKLAIARAVYLYLGKNLSYYHGSASFVSSEYITGINQESLNQINRNVICFTWSAIYKEALITAGFNEKDIKIFGVDGGPKHLDSTHNLVMFRINENYYIADATFGYDMRANTDLLAIKLGGRTLGFYQLDNDTGKKNFESNNEVLSFHFKEREHGLNAWSNEDLDARLGYTTDREFYEKASELEKILIDSGHGKGRLLTIDEMVEIFIDIIDSNEMNADEIYEVYSLIIDGENQNNIKIATLTSNYANTEVRYSILSVRASDGSVRYFFKEDYTKFKEVQDLANIFNKYNINKKARIGELL